MLSKAGRAVGKTDTKNHWKLHEPADGKIFLSHLLCVSSFLIKINDF